MDLLASHGIVYSRHADSNTPSAFELATRVRLWLPLMIPLRVPLSSFMGSFKAPFKASAMVSLKGSFQAFLSGVPLRVL